MRDKPTRFYSSKQEKSVAKLVGGKQQANSGASTWQKGDVVNDRFLIECKTHTKEQKQTTIQKDWLDKIREEAFGIRKDYYALAFDFGPDTDKYFVISERLFRKLDKMLKEENEL